MINFAPNQRINNFNSIKCGRTGQKTLHQLRRLKAVNPTINKTSFGSITVDGESYDHDIIITLDGIVKKRKKKLSKAVYGTSHKISLDEIRYTYQDMSEGIVIGSGQHGIAELSNEASQYLNNNNCQVVLRPTPEAIQEWNKSKGRWIGLFHITC